MSNNETEVREGRYFPHLIRTQGELAEAVAHISTFDHFVVDVESPKVGDGWLGTTQNTVSWIGLAVPDKVYLIPMGHERGPVRVPAHKEKRLPPDDQRKVLKDGSLSKTKKSYSVEATYYDGGVQLRQDVVFDLLAPLFFSNRIKIGHNVKFDLESIAKYYGGIIPPGPYADTMIMTHVLDENIPKYDLKGLYMDWVRVPKDPKARQKFYPNLGKIGVESQPLDQVARYLAMDVWRCLQFYREHIHMINENPKFKRVFWDDEMTVYPILMKMEMQGIRIDTDLLAQRGKVLIEEREALAQEIWDICGESFEITNLDKKKHFLFAPKSKGGQGLKPISFTDKTHQPQVTAAVLEVYADDGDGNPLAIKLLEWAEKEKMISTFITGLTAKLIGDRLHTSFNQHRTVTSRLSSSGPNLHQIPRGPFLRDCFIADEGYKLIVADYSQMELRIAADFSGDPEMMRVFLDDLDIHLEAAAAMLGMDPEEVTPELRMIGKTQNLGTLYGAGPKKVASVAIAAGVKGVTAQTGKDFVDAYNKRFAELARWKRQVVIDAKRSVKAGSGLPPFVEIPPYGRQRRLPMLYARDDKLRSRAERQAVNSIVQGYGAYILKQAMRDLDAKIEGTPTKVLLNVHDELIVMTPEHMAEEVLPLVQATMEDVRSPDGSPAIGNVPLTVNAAIADRWSEGK